LKCPHKLSCSPSRSIKKTGNETKIAALRESCIIPSVININPHTPTVVQGGVDGPPPLGFCCGTISGKDFTFDRYSLQDEVIKYYGLWRCW